jgi:hypothetical protein
MGPWARRLVKGCLCWAAALHWKALWFGARYAWSSAEAFSREIARSGPWCAPLWTFRCTTRLMNFYHTFWVSQPCPAPCSRLTCRPLDLSVNDRDSCRSWQSHSVTFFCNGSKWPLGHQFWEQWGFALTLHPGLNSSNKTAPDQDEVMMSSEQQKNDNFRKWLHSAM